MSSITDMKQEIQQSIKELQTTHVEIRNKAIPGHGKKNSIHDTINHLEGIEERMGTLEETQLRNKNKLKSILEMTESLSKKSDVLSVCFAKYKERLPSLGSSAPNLNSGTLDQHEMHTTGNNSLAFNNEAPDSAAKCVTKTETLDEQDNHVQTRVNKPDTSIGSGTVSQIIEQPAKVNITQSNPGLTVSQIIEQPAKVNITQSNPGLTVSQIIEQPAKVNITQSNPGLTVSQIIEQPAKVNITQSNPGLTVSQIIEQPAKVNITQRNPSLTKSSETTKPHRPKCKSGYKSCLTREDLDNRGRHRSTKRCYEGHLLHSNTVNIEQTDPPRPNIVHQERLPKDISLKQDERMQVVSERDIDEEQKVYSIKQWYEHATVSELKVSLNLTISGNKFNRRGHTYVLLLDISESMRGDKFDLMIKTAKEYIRGHQEVSNRYGVHDNVGLACFGEKTDLLLPPMFDYDGVLAELDKLKPGGPSPLTAGIIMSLSAITRGLGITAINHHPVVKSHVIIMTDGIPTRLEALNEEDTFTENNPLAASSFMTNFQMKRELKGVVGDFARRGFKIYCVHFGSGNTGILAAVAKDTHGRLVPHDQIHRMSRMTMTLFDASEIAHLLQHVTDINRDMVKNAIQTYELNDPYDDITDHAILLHDPVADYPGYFKKPKWPSSPLGSRVRRGPNWKYQNEDNNMAGTVIGGGVNDEDMICVEWDSGNRNSYGYEEDKKIFEVKIVNEPRLLLDDIIAVGCKVKRGRDWKNGNEDGGIGNKGTVLRVEETGKIVVYWEIHRLAIYKFATDDAFEVEVCSQTDQTINSSNPVVAVNNTPQIIPQTSISPHILPEQSSKKKQPVTAQWQYQNQNERWTLYDNDINDKIEKAFIRKPNGMYIVEIDRIVYVLKFSPMTQENQTTKSISAIKRLALESAEREEKIIYED